MKIFSGILLVFVVACNPVGRSLISQDDMTFLEGLTRAVVDSSRILPGEDLPPAIRSYGPNRSGITLIKPGGRDCYPSFWIRDYALSLESGLITQKEQLEILVYTAERQSDSTWTTRTGSRVPKGSIPDHIRINDGLPVYFPGTYDYLNQGNEIWRLPPLGDQFFFIHMAAFYLDMNTDPAILDREMNQVTLFNRLEMAFEAVRADPATGMAFISDSMPTCDFGFRDVIGMTGQVCFGSLLRYRAAQEMAELCGLAGKSEKSEYYLTIARNIKKNLVPVFADSRGMLRASTGKSSQPDVWATAFAAYIGALEGSGLKNACRVLAYAYSDGTLACEGQIRHVLTSDDFDSGTAWEKSLAAKNTYQNGAYWGTPTGWVCFAIAQADKKGAGQLAGEFVDHLRKTDFRVKGPLSGGPWECVYPESGYTQNPVYMTTVTVPLAGFKRLDR